jgi:hypothetical protein
MIINGLDAKVIVAIIAAIISAISGVIAFLKFQETKINKTTNSKDFKGLAKQLKKNRDEAFEYSQELFQKKSMKRAAKVKISHSLNKSLRDIDRDLKSIKSFLHNATKLNGRINTRNVILKLIDETMSDITIINTEKRKKQVKIILKDLKNDKNPFEKIDQIIKELTSIKTAE